MLKILVNVQRHLLFLQNTKTVFLKHDLNYRRITLTACGRNKLAHTNNEVKDMNEQSENTDVVNYNAQPSKSVTTVEPQFPDLIHEAENKIDFWKTERGLQLKDTLWTGVGRFLRLFINIERYDNAWEKSMSYQLYRPYRYNRGDQVLLDKHGPEWAAGYLVLHLGGAFKLVTDDRWIDNSKYLRTQTQKDFTLEAIDLRGTIVSVVGLSKLENLGYVRYLNFADCQLFDNLCMTKLHPVADTLEFLDISGTKVTPEGFSYLRIFPRLKWLNISRLGNPERTRKLIPYLLEILPIGCVVIMDDERSSLCYGSEIPFRHLTNPTKDHLIDGKCAIGDLTLFEEAYGKHDIQLYDITAVYELWKTPKLSNQRKQRIKLLRIKEPRFGTMAQYINKAEKYPPLL